MVTSAPRSSTAPADRSTWNGARGRHYALVRVSLCTVCGSDLHTFTGRRKEKTPCVLGHEPVGVVEEVNGDLRDVTGDPVCAGDRVVWSVAVACG